ncbi:MAG: hypothetical protein WEG40_13225 [Candidatus Rokuibacteriota bacterium]
MASLRFKVLGGTLLGLLLALTAIALLSTLREPARPTVEPKPVEVPAAAAPIAPAAPEPAAAPAVSRSKGQSEWAFFFRAGDTLSRMADGTPLGVVVRVERRHAFPDGSTGPAYVVRSPDLRETAFDADELERGARIEEIRDVRVPPARLPDAAPTR